MLLICGHFVKSFLNIFLIEIESFV